VVLNIWNLFMYGAPSLRGKFWNLSVHVQWDSVPFCHKCQWDHSSKIVNFNRCASPGRWILFYFTQNLYYIGQGK
jgi:hypothetical protein